MKPYKHIIGLFLMFTCISCLEQPKMEKSRSCVERIIKLDDSLGTVRNHACETISISKTIINYTDALSNMDFSECPEAFKMAFKNHEIAWRSMIPIADKYPELRGELHDLFDQIEVSNDSAAFKKALKDIHDTWSPIEDIVNKK